MSFDLDDEELKATRESNGADRRGVEEDIKRLKEKINNIKKYNTYRYDWTETDIQTLEHLIKAYKEQNDTIKTANIAIKDLQEKLNNYIPVSLVEEKIEELKIQRRELGFKTYLRREDMLNDDRKIVREIEVLQELLEKR